MPFLPVVEDALTKQLAAEIAAGRGKPDDFVFLTANGRTYTRQNISERGIERAGVRAGLGTGGRGHVLRHSFCTFVAESGIPPNEGAALTGHDEQTWWRSYVSPRRDAQSRRENVAKLTALGFGLRPEVDQRGLSAESREVRESERPAFAGLSREPSDGLEPSTPSLPWRCSTS
jgi:hypothetical protein